MIFWFSASICIIVLGAQIYLRSFGNKSLVGFSFVSVLKYIFPASIAAILGNSFYLSYLQRQKWAGDEIFKSLLTQKVDLSGLQVDYFLYYAATRFFASLLLAFLAAALFFFIVKFLNNRYEQRFLYEEEYWLGALGIFLSGYPGLVFYLIFLTAFFTIFQIAAFVFSKSRDRRISLYYFWMPLALASVFLSNILLSNLSLWRLLEI